jgi:hypothetical protein
MAMPSSAARASTGAARRSISSAIITPTEPATRLA